ncbi:MAG: LemA family protein [Thermoprotei archaeon]|nr:MAG: LemA family protein [Thermoprotei archaeon]
MIEWIILGAVILVILGFIAYLVSVYNRFMKLKNAAEASLNQIKVGLQKRMDLLAELVEATKSYVNYERSVLESVTKLRTEVYAAATPEKITEAERESRALLGRILAVAENYPDLKASEVVTNLMNSAKSVEDEIARLRYTYNNVVQEYNTMIDMFPSNMIASFMGLRKLPYLEVPREAEQRPRLTF